MLLCSLAASAIILSSEPAPFHSVRWFDNIIQLSQRDLDRSICKTIAAVTPNPAPDGTQYTDEHIQIVRNTYQRAVAQHCQLRLKIDGKLNAADECGEGFSQSFTH